MPDIAENGMMVTEFCMEKMRSGKNECIQIGDGRMRCRRWICFLAAMVLLLVSCGAAAEETEEEILGVSHTSVETDGQNIRIAYSSLKDGTVIIRSVDLPNDDSITTFRVPDAIDGKAVTGIWEQAFYICGVKEIVLPETITRIGDTAFSLCHSLEKINLPKNLVSLGNEVFRECVVLSGLTVPASLTELHGNPFAGRHGPSFLSVDENHPFLKIRDNALFNQETMTLIHYLGEEYAAEYTIPDGTEAVGENAFYGAYELEKVTFPDSVKQIGKNAFHLCFSLKEVLLPKNLEEISDGAFRSCSLNSIYLPEKVHTIGTEVFVDNPLEMIEIAEGNETFSFRESSLFRDGGKKLILFLESAYYKAKAADVLKKMEKDALASAAWLEDADEDPETKELMLKVLGKIQDIIREMREELKGGDAGALRLILSDSTWITTIAQNDTKDPGLARTAAEILSGIWEKNRIPDYQIPEGTEGIGSRAFSFCSTLSTLDLPEGIREIEDEAFAGILSLTRITFPSSVESLGKDVLSDCPKLTEVRLPEEIAEIPEGMFLHCTELKTIDLPEHLAAIGDNAFRYSGLEAIRIPEGVKRIGANAFADCIGLAEVLLPAGLEVLEQYAFSGCEALSGISLPEGIREMMDGVFSRCLLLQEVAVPGSIRNIHDFAFSGNTGLKRIVIGEGTETIGSCAFLGCSLLEEVHLPESLKEIGNSAFSNCSSLKTIHLPEGLTTVSENAFEGCPLPDLALPGSSPD